MFFLTSKSKLSVEKSADGPSLLTAAAASSSVPPPAVECYICGKKFGTHSIKIHEKQCLKKWQVENNSLPPDMRAPDPVRKAKSPIKASEVELTKLGATDSVERKSSSESSGSGSGGRRPPMFPCYICGRLFTVNSIYIHEPQCLKKWQVENDKLPPHKQKPQPLKPDIKFTPDGKIDYERTTEDYWQTHLNQLIPCKFCARTFNPDRVETHERSCKG